MNDKLIKTIKDVRKKVESKFDAVIKSDNIKILEDYYLELKKLELLGLSMGLPAKSIEKISIKKSKIEDKILKIKKGEKI